MQSSTAASPSPGTRNFAGLLADFAAPDNKFPPRRDADGLAEDVVTLTYEKALRGHARYRPLDEPSAPPARLLCSEPALASSAGAEAGEDSVPSSVRARRLDKRKASSVTVRLTQEENDQLRQRAAEAGMTVSAYLRSCAFEVEGLRAQVKQTIADLRAAKSAAGPTSGWRRILSWVRKPSSFDPSRRSARIAEPIKP